MRKSAKPGPASGKGTTTATSGSADRVKTKLEVNFNAVVGPAKSIPASLGGDDEDEVDKKGAVRLRGQEDDVAYLMGLEQDDTEEFFHDYMGLPYTGHDLRKKSTLNLVKGEAFLGTVNRLFLPASARPNKTHFPWRPDHLPNLTCAEKAELELFLRLYGRRSAASVPKTLAYSYKYWKRLKLEVNWTAYGLHAMRGQWHNLKKVKDLVTWQPVDPVTAVRADWAKFVKAKQEGQPVTLKRKRPFPSTYSEQAADEDPQGTQLTPASNDAAGLVASNSTPSPLPRPPLSLAPRLFLPWLLSMRLLSRLQ